MIKAVVFDFGGVLVDTYEYHYRTYAKKYKNLSTEKHKWLFEGNVLERRNQLPVKNDNLNVSVEIQKYLMKQHVKKSIIKFLKVLEEKYLLFIITARKDNFLRNFLLKEKILNLFTDVLGSDTQIHKDLKFDILLDKYLLKKEEVIFVTDTLGDILEAKKSGIKTIAVDFGFHERARLEKGKPFRIVSRFEDILGVIAEI